MSLEDQAEARKNRLSNLRNRGRQDKETSSVEKTEDRKPVSIVRRNFDRESRAPINAFTSETLQIELEGKTVEVVDQDEENELIQGLSKHYAADLEEEEEVIEENSIVSEYKDSLLPVEKKLEKLTQKAIRRAVRERIEVEASR